MEQSCDNSRDDHGRKFTESVGDELGGGVRGLLAILTLLLAVPYALFIYYMMSWVAHNARQRGMESALWAIIYAVPHLVTSTSILVYAVVFVGISSLLSTKLTIASFFMALGVVALTAPIAWSGFFIYLLSRTRGELVRCARCPGYHLTYAQTCSCCGWKVARDAAP